MGTMYSVHSSQSKHDVSRLSPWFGLWPIGLWIYIHRGSESGVSARVQKELVSYSPSMRWVFAVDHRFVGRSIRSKEDYSDREYSSLFDVSTQSDNHAMGPYDSANQVIVSPFRVSRRYDFVCLDFFFSYSINLHRAWPCQPTVWFSSWCLN